MGSFGRRLELWRILAGTRDAMTLRELAGRLGVSKNTVQRDLDELSRAGIAVRERQQGRALRFAIGSGPGAAGSGRRETAVLREAASVLEAQGEPGLAAAVREVAARLAAGPR